MHEAVRFSAFENLLHMHDIVFFLLKLVECDDE